MEDTKRGFIVSGATHGMVYLRFVVCNHSTNEDHIKKFFDYIVECSKQVIEK